MTHPAAANARRILAAATEDAAADPRPTTPGCPHNRRWCEGCEDARAQAADRAEIRRMDERGEW